MKRSWLPLLAMLAAVALLWHRLPALPEAEFVATPATSAPLATAAFVPLMLPQAGTTAHSVSLTSLGKGRIAAAWFSGSREGAADVAIVMSVFDGRQWSPAVPVMERPRAQHDTGRLIRKLGNPVLWHDPAGVLHLWFVSVSYGGWAGSAINHSFSTDEGLHWSPVERLITSPFLNLSTLVHAAPLALNDGIGLPVYHEFIAKRPEWLRLDSAGQIIDKIRLPATSKLLQPAVAALDAHRAIALLRDTGPMHRIYLAPSEYAGAEWKPATATVLPNPNAGIALLHLADGRLLLVYNPQESDRNKLALTISRDSGTIWSTPRVIEDSASGDEFSYPALVQDEAGTIHLAYTWKRQSIKHLRFTPATLESAP